MASLFDLFLSNIQEKVIENKIKMKVRSLKKKGKNKNKEETIRPNYMKAFSYDLRVFGAHVEKTWAALLPNTTVGMTSFSPDAHVYGSHASVQ